MPWKPIENLDRDHPELKRDKAVLFGVLDVTTSKLVPCLGYWSAQNSNWMLAGSMPESTISPLHYDPEAVRSLPVLRG